MDRLPAVSSTKVLLVLACSLVTWSGCFNESVEQPLRERVVAVAAKENAGERLSEFCDVVGSSSASRTLNLPALDRQVSFEKGMSRWVNVWATWCAPCIEEIPMLLTWQPRFKADGGEVTLKLISVDEELEQLRSFEKKHPQYPTSLHLKEQDALLPFITALGLDKGAGLPIHVFADKEGKILCVRAAAIKPTHYKTVLKLLSSSKSEWK